MSKRLSDQIAPLQEPSNRLIEKLKADEVRRVLWREFQRGSLSEEELGRSLDRLEFDSRMTAPTLDPPSPR